MDNSLCSILNETLPKKNRVFGQYCMLVTGLILFFGICIFPAGAENSQNITLNPIGDHASGEKINITGTISIEKCKQVGIEILPKSYWDLICEFAQADSTGRVVFNPIASTKDNFDPSGIKIVRFNADGTQSTQIVDLPTDHVLVTGPVEKGKGTEKSWSVLIEKNDNGTPLSPGTYHVNIWDATNQKKPYDNPMPNGWDIVHQKIYPSTGRINIWDPVNQREMVYAELVIR